jgi:hypothetical protein
MGRGERVLGCEVRQVPRCIYNPMPMLRRIGVFLLGLLALASSAAQQAPESLSAKAHDSLSPIHGNLVVPGLKQPVDVLRDR